MISMRTPENQHERCLVAESTTLSTVRWAITIFSELLGRFTPYLPLTAVDHLANIVDLLHKTKAAIHESESY